MIIQALFEANSIIAFEDEMLYKGFVQGPMKQRGWKPNPNYRPGTNDPECLPDPTQDIYQKPLIRFITITT